MIEFKPVDLKYAEEMALYIKDEKINEYGILPKQMMLTFALKIIVLYQDFLIVANIFTAFQDKKTTLLSLSESLKNRLEIFFFTTLHKKGATF